MRNVGRYILLTALAIAILAIIPPILVYIMSLQIGFGPILAIIVIAILVAFLIGILVIISRQEELRIQGFTGEWMLAAAISPGAAIALALFEEANRRADAIDPDDKRLRDL